MTQTRRIGGKDNATRELILDATERLLVEIGYGAISTRKIAKAIAVTPTLIHYYFPTTDDLLIELYRRSARENTQRIDEALASENPLSALWIWLEHAQRNALATEFLALANHRPALRQDIATYVESSRKRLVECLNDRLQADEPTPDHDGLTPLTLTMLVTAVSRLVVLEQAIGLNYGHTETLSFIEHLIASVAHRAPEHGEG